jgi:hypothetical protein
VTATTGPLSLQCISEKSGSVSEGCVAVPLSKYDSFHTRICRPVGLTETDRKAVIARGNLEQYRFSSLWAPAEFQIELG